jgi:hypothetical protein
LAKSLLGPIPTEQDRPVAALMQGLNRGGDPREVDPHDWNR